jgi:hypothetical protein
MRFTFGTFKFAAREPTFRIAAAGQAPRFPSTAQSLRMATRIYHDQGPDAARRALRSSLRAPYWRTGIGAGKAAVARRLLDEYMRLDSAAGRKAAGFNIKTDVAVGSDVIAVAVDVCLFANVDYAARLILWDARPCTSADARILLAPCVLALEHEFGTGSVEDGEVIHVRTSTVYSETRARALAALPDVEAVLKRAQR